VNKSCKFIDRRARKVEVPSMNTLLSVKIFGPTVDSRRSAESIG